MTTQAPSSVSSNLDERIEKLFKLHEKIADQVGGISENQGDAAEAFFVNSLMDHKTLEGIQFQEVLRKSRAESPDSSKSTTSF